MKKEEMDIGLQDGNVVIKFGQPVTTLPLTPAMARDVAVVIVTLLDPDEASQAAEDIARIAHAIKYNIKPGDKSYIAEKVRNKLLTRVAHVIRNLSEKNKPPLYIANHVVDTILSEAL